MKIPRDELFLMCSFCVQLALLIFVLSLVGCGGGSEGTGIGGNTLQGTVSLDENIPVEGALVTVAETGQSALTDVNGKFSIETPVSVRKVTLAVSVNNVDGNVVIPELPVEPSTVDVDIHVNPETQSVDATAVNAKASVVGLCDAFFENEAVIRQSNPIADGTSCVAKVTLKSNGRALRGVPVAIRARPCNDLAPWQTIATAVTAKDLHGGIAQLSFQFFNTPEYCDYQIVAPYGTPQYQSVFISIRTFQRAAVDASR